MQDPWTDSKVHCDSWTPRGSPENAYGLIIEYGNSKHEGPVSPVTLSLAFTCPGKSSKTNIIHEATPWFAESNVESGGEWHNLTWRGANLNNTHQKTIVWHRKRTQAQSSANDIYLLALQPALCIGCLGHWIHIATCCMYVKLLACLPRYSLVF